ncbi:MAG TPA: peptidoglycan-binding protein [Kofleriaceae bacterium]
MVRGTERQTRRQSGDLDGDGDRDLEVNGQLDRYGAATARALQALCSSEPEFLPKLERICARLGTETEWLVNVMMMESSLDPARKNPNSTATGLIQFMARTARGLGTTVGALRRMSATRQLDYVERYLEPFAGRLSSQAAVYASIAAGRVGSSDRSVFFRRGSREYRANRVWDQNRDGAITQGELGRLAGRYGAGDQFEIDGGNSEEREEREGEGSGEERDGEQPGSQPGATRPGQLVTDSVGVGGSNVDADVRAVQTALQARGQDVGTIDGRVGPMTIRAIRNFQRGFMRAPDGLIEVGKITEQHLTSNTTPPRRQEGVEEQEEDRDGNEELRDPSDRGERQMQRLVSTADNVAGRRPGGMCYRSVKHHITNAGGYGNIRNIYTDPRFSSAQAEARMFAERVNTNPARFGLERLSISNPYEAPEGSIIVVAPGSPGTRHPTAGDIVVKGPGDTFFNDGNMSYRGRSAWPPSRGGVLGVYRPR